MPNYANGKIYKIVCNTSGLVYIGSTTSALSYRLNKHKTHYTQFKTGKIKGQCTSFPLLEGGNVKIELIEMFPCETKQQLLAQEGYHIKISECVNKLIPGRLTEEKQELTKTYNDAYYIKNKEAITTQTKEYREKNKAIITAKLQEKMTCECGCTVSRRNIATHRKTETHKTLVGLVAVDV